MSELAKVMYVAWDLRSRSYIITLHFCAKVVEKKNDSKFPGCEVNSVFIRAQQPPSYQKAIRFLKISRD